MQSRPQKADFLFLVIYNESPHLIFFLAFFSFFFCLLLFINREFGHNKIFVINKRLFCKKSDENWVKSLEV